MYTVPSLEELGALSDEGLGAVTGFRLGHVEWGEIRWMEAVDLRRILSRLVPSVPSCMLATFERGAVNLDREALRNDAPSLAGPATVKLVGVWPTASRDPLALATHEDHLETLCRSARWVFLGYDGATGTWTFHVANFLAPPPPPSAPFHVPDTGTAPLGASGVVYARAWVAAVK